MPENGHDHEIDTPFSQSPNPNALYLTPALKNKLAKVKFAINARQGLSALLGDVGLGKSTLLRYLYGEYAARENVDAALMVHPGVFPSDFAMLKNLCRDLEVPIERTLQKQLDLLEEFLLAAYDKRRNVIFFIDEADRMNYKKLELLRSILNFETAKHKLVQIVIAGQLDLFERFKRKAEYKALVSRIFTTSLLDSLSAGELTGMIEHRCSHAEIENPFTAEALERLYEVTGGNPRTALKICATTYAAMIGTGGDSVDRDAIEEVENDATIFSVDEDEQIGKKRKRSIPEEEINA